MSTENKINQIMWGAHFSSVRNGQNESVLLVLKAASLKDRCFIDFIYNQALDEAKRNNVITEFEFRSRLKAKNIWDEKRDEYIEASIKRIKELEDKLKECKRGERNYRITANLLKTHKKTLTEELVIRNQLFYVTAEQHADEVKNRAVVFACTFDEFENKYWKSWSEFEQEKDLKLIDNIAIALNETPQYDSVNIREVARSSEWRCMWMAAKGNIQALFGTSVGEFATHQRNLTYWSQVYDSVYEAYERPSEEVINDDEALDKWFEEQARKSRKERLQKSGEAGKLKVSSGVRRHGEVFIITNPEMNPNSPYRENPVMPTNQDVEELNSSFVRNFKKKEQEIIKERKMIPEQNLRSRNNKIARMTIGSSDAVLGKGNFAGRSKPKIVPGGIG